MLGDTGVLGDLGPVVYGPGAYGRGRWVDCLDTNLDPMGWGDLYGNGVPSFRRLGQWKRKETQRFSQEREGQTDRIGTENRPAAAVKDPLVGIQCFNDLHSRPFLTFRPPPLTQHPISLSATPSDPGTPVSCAKACDRLLRGEERCIKLHAVIIKATSWERHAEGSV